MEEEELLGEIDDDDDPSLTPEEDDLDFLDLNDDEFDRLNAAIEEEKQKKKSPPPPLPPREPEKEKKEKKEEKEEKEEKPKPRPKIEPKPTPKPKAVPKTNPKAKPKPKGKPKPTPVPEKKVVFNLPREEVFEKEEEEEITESELESDWEDFMSFVNEKHGQVSKGEAEFIKKNYFEDPRAHQKYLEKLEILRRLGNLRYKKPTERTLDDYLAWYGVESGRLKLPMGSLELLDDPPKSQGQNKTEPTPGYFSLAWF